MKITRVDAIPVNVPLHPDLTTKTATGEHVVSPYVVLELATDTGLIGWGEATLSPRWSGETSPGCVAVIDGLLAPLLLGQDPRELNRLRATIDRAIRHNPFTKAAVEMALWDLAGKAAGVPVCQLLGGKVRDRLPLKMVVGAFPVEKATALAQRFLDQGVRHLKVKVGLDPEEDLARVRAVRELAGPDVTLGIDANQGWSLPVARRMLAEMRDCNLLFVEQPVAAGDPASLAELRRSTTIPIMADESIFTPADAIDLVAARAVDILSVYPGKHGGLAATRQIAEIAEAAGMVCSMGSNLELGIGAAAMLHVAAAVPAIASERFPGDFLGPLYHQADLLTQPLQLGPEFASIPDGPGLGVSLDWQQVEQFRDNSQQARQLDS